MVTAPSSTALVGPARASAEPSEPELLAAAYLNRVAEPGSIPLWLLVQEYGYLAAAEAVRTGQVSDEVAGATEARRESADPATDLAAAERNEIRLVMPGSADWPDFAVGSMERLARRRSAEWLAGRRNRSAAGELIPPLALWVRGAGRLATIGARSIAIVGSRSASSYGDHLASDFAYGLARQDVTVVSGGAYGIDSAAHRGVLAADGESVLVSAGGLDRPYPAGHAALYHRTAELGLLVSERPPGSAPHRQRFLSRNRLIAAFGTATLVVEAGHRSGALNTARHARELGRPVLAVPGPVTSAMSVGCHRLLQRDEDPARLVTSIAEILTYCGPVQADDPGVGSDHGVGSDPGAGGGLGLGGDFDDGLWSPADWDTADRAYDALDPTARSVLDGFPIGEVATLEQLSRLSGVAIAAVREALPDLVELGLVRAGAQGYRLVRPDR